MARADPEPAEALPAPSNALAGRTALVTGAARRVGATIVRVLHGAGANVVVHYRSSAEDAARLAAELNTARERSAVVAECDLLDVTQHSGLIATAVQAFGALDILVNNASTFYPTPVGDITADRLGRSRRHESEGAAVPRAGRRPCAARSVADSIINIADIHGMRPLRRYPVYSLAKAGVIMLTLSLARELGPQVRVNAIAPGPVMWPEDGMDAALRPKILGAHRVEARRLRGRRGTGVPLLRDRGAVRHRPGARGRRRAQHRLVTRLRSRSRRAPAARAGGPAGRSGATAPRR